MIDKRFYEVKPTLFYRDLAVPGVVLVVAYTWCLAAETWWGILLAYVVAVIALHRAAILLHDICHQYSNPKLQRLILAWDLTIGAITAVPSPRFLKSHRIHHAVGTFRTKDDPQYLLLRSDKTLGMFVLAALPLLMPLVGLITAIGTSLFGMRLEEAIDRAATRRGMTLGNVIEPEYHGRVIWISRLTVALYALYALALPQTLPVAYAVLAGGWYMATLRMPLEHRLESLLDRPSDREDQLRDSFTIETPLAALFQPLAMRFHSAHHLYPGVPYHNLAEVHRHLKDIRPEYRETIKPFWTLVKGGIPEAPRTPAASEG